MMVRVFADCPGEQGSIKARIIPKTQKMGLDISFFNTQYSKLRIKGKLSNPGKEVGSSPTPRCSC